MYAYPADKPTLGFVTVGTATAAYIELVYSRGMFVRGTELSRILASARATGEKLSGFSVSAVQLPEEDVYRLADTTMVSQAHPDAFRLVEALPSTGGLPSEAGLMILNANLRHPQETLINGAVFFRSWAELKHTLSANADERSMVDFSVTEKRQLSPAILEIPLQSYTDDEVPACISSITGMKVLLQEKAKAK